MHFGVRHWRAKKVIRANGEANFLANSGELFRTFDGDFEFRFFVFLYFEVATGFCVTDGGRDVVAAERRLLRKIKLTTEGAAIGECQILFEDLAVVWIFDRHADGLAVE